MLVTGIPESGAAETFDSGRVQGCIDKLSFFDKEEATPQWKVRTEESLLSSLVRKVLCSVTMVFFIVGEL